MPRTTDVNIELAEVVFWAEYNRHRAADEVEYLDAVRAGIEAVLGLQPEPQKHGDHERLAI